jgi:hypothetical protein
VCNSEIKGRGARQQIWQKKEGILHDLQKIHKAANQKARSQVYEWATENGRLNTVEGPATAYEREEAAYSIRTGNAGAPATLGSLPPQRKMKNGKNCILDELAHYQGDAWD